MSAVAPPITPTLLTEIKCPFRYFLGNVWQHELNIPQSIEPVTGAVMHRQMHDYYTKRWTDASTFVVAFTWFLRRRVEEALKLHINPWLALYGDSEMLQREYSPFSIRENEALAKIAMRQFFEARRKSQKRPWALEHPLLSEMNGLELSARVDAIFVTQGLDWVQGDQMALSPNLSQILVVDYKTGSRPPAESDIRNSAQFRMYTFALRDYVGVLKLAIYNPRQPKGYQYIQLDARELNLSVLQKEVLEAAESIAFWQGQERWPPHPYQNRCQWCEYQVPCPHYTGLNGSGRIVYRDEQSQGMPLNWASLEGVELAELIAAKTGLKKPQPKLTPRHPDQLSLWL
ncbi:MAG: PD-(D/E)XK nuclease family protein [Candidatus Woesearchaeota archaeon]